MTHIAVSFNEGRKYIEIKIVVPKVISEALIRIYAWRRRNTGRPPFGDEGLILSSHMREDLGLPDTLSVRDRVMMRHPARF